MMGKNTDKAGKIYPEDCKSFFDTFTSIKLKKEEESLFRDVIVERICLTRNRSGLSVYILSSHLLPKPSVHNAENAIYTQFFSGKKVSVHLIERFQLSDQYSAKALFEMYGSSISMELKERSIIIYDMFHKGVKTWVNDDILKLSISDSKVHRRESTELERVLRRLFTDRCGIDFSIEISFSKENPSQYSVPSSQYPVPSPQDSVPSSKYPMYSQSSSVEGVLERASSEEFLDEFVDGFSEAVFPDHYVDSPSVSDLKDPKDNIDKDSSNKNVSVSLKDYDKGNKKKSEKKNEKGNDKGNNKENAKISTKGNAAGALPKNSRRSPFRPFNDADTADTALLYGRNFTEEAIPISEISEESGGQIAVLEGKILSVLERRTKNGKTIFNFAFTDETDSITSKIFVEDQDLEDARRFLFSGNGIRIKGVIEYDAYDKELELSHITGIKKHTVKQNNRVDTAREKRVELHLHTKMSDMDGVSDVTEYIDTAISFGMNAMAITDHGVVQSFPDAASYLKKTGHDKDFKLIYGMEGYLVDDLQKIVVNDKGQKISDEAVVFDIETTGFSPQKDRIIEIGAVKVRDGAIVDRMNVFVNPERPIPFRITELTSISDEMVMGADTIEHVLPKFLDFCGAAVIVAHNAEFDTGFIKANAARLGLSYDPTIIDTVGLSRLLLKKLKRFKLDTVAKELKVSLENHHRAVDDAECTAEIYIKECGMLSERGVSLIGQIDTLQKDKAEMVRKLPSYHVILLAKNDTGRINLYRLVSESHLNYFRKSPRIPKSLLSEYREGLLIGSACVQGELFQAIIRGQDEKDLLDIASFYDYLEIQPLTNNSFMLNSDRYSASSEQDLIDYNLRVVSIGEILKKPVCATCDAHYVHPKEDIYRRIIMSGRGYDDAEEGASLYFRTTDEMLEAFSYLTPDKAKEVVVRNPGMISDMCEIIHPVRPDKCPPIIPGLDSDKELRDICYETAHAMYGPVLPKVVSDRLETELRSIIQNGYAVMYIIAQRLVDKSNEDGYLVGSRGSVGSSFVATMAHITEVNPLSPHYVCPKCFYSDFDSEEVRRFSGMAGCDMPKKNCPECGTDMNRWGFDIPFETFLGFEGDKEPDIDLNFSGEYQAKAHAYTGVLFGEHNTFKAGTIGTLADKTAFGLVKHYYEDKGVVKRNAEVDRLASCLVGIRRTTGQHPGGIVVLPIGEDINTFTPVQHPANDADSPIVTTHFDYHKIDHNLLKLDILGHDDPTMIRKLQDLTGMDMVKDIPFDQKEVMSLFQSTEALNIRPEDIQGVRLGCLGIPEFGTSFAMQMVEETKPKYFSDLLRISGLSHGTDVWLNNAQDLILSGTASLQDAICCRDDIMVYLIHMGVNPALSFKIMEATRKGKGLKTEWEGEMLSHNVPQWYLDSCNKIKYMFPKAHAAAYVMMAWRVAFCKVFYPKEYYAAYFSIRADGFDYDKMCFGLDKLRYWIKKYKEIPHPTNTESVCLRDMKITEEMYVRGIEFAPIDLYKAKAIDFQIMPDGRIMPGFTCMAGLGESVARGIEEGAKGGEFLSRDDFISRTHCPKAFADRFAELGILSDVPESNQMSIFDFA